MESNYESLRNALERRTITNVAVRNQLIRSQRLVEYHERKCERLLFIIEQLEQKNAELEQEVKAVRERDESRLRNNILLRYWGRVANINILAYLNIQYSNNIGN